MLSCNIASGIVVSSVIVDSFKHIARAVERDIFSYSYAMLRDESEAKDITQEVLVKLWQQRDLREEEGARRWVLRVARNACLDSLKHSKVRREYAQSHPTDSATTETPYTATKRKHDREAVLHAIGKLQEPQRSIVIMKDLQQYSYKEISEALELSDSQVKVYLHRARKKLHGLLLGATNYEQR